MVAPRRHEAAAEFGFGTATEQHYLGEHCSVLTLELGRGLEKVVQKLSASNTSWVDDHFQRAVPYSSRDCNLTDAAGYQKIQHIRKK